MKHNQRYSAVLGLLNYCLFRACLFEWARQRIRAEVKIPGEIASTADTSPADIGRGRCGRCVRISVGIVSSIRQELDAEVVR
jgi:hypothetical protein